MSIKTKPKNDNTGKNVLETVLSIAGLAVAVFTGIKKSQNKGLNT